MMAPNIKNAYELDLDTLTIQPQSIPQFPTKPPNLTLFFGDFPTNLATGSFYTAAHDSYTGDAYFLEVSITHSIGKILKKQRISQYPCFIRYYPALSFITWTWDPTEDRLIALGKQFLTKTTVLITVSFNEVADNCKILYNFTDMNRFNFNAGSAISVGKIGNEKKYFITTISNGICPRVNVIDLNTGLVETFISDINDALVGWKWMNDHLYGVVFGLQAYYDIVPLNYSLIVDVDKSRWKRLKEYNMLNLKDCIQSEKQLLYSYRDIGVSFISNRNLITFLTCFNFSFTHEKNIMALSVNLDNYEMKLTNLNIPYDYYYSFTDLSSYGP